ncbi:hypothetical protein Godav_012154 [Gossypium davidsonii]|uniref:Uncharacterized protein n=2 Tax=Gossypium TaxID=3633 RepID=A0A7J8RDN1_GOSDV|nr:hypothetical protein [Gossypium davidsonii]MBA0646587.1 hypothetical protein [Gossypium klotzschianum]
MKALYVIFCTSNNENVKGSLNAQSPRKHVTSLKRFMKKQT